MFWTLLDFGEKWCRNCEKIIRCYIRILFVDNAAMQMILNPKQFDVILTENMFGDIISDENQCKVEVLLVLLLASIGNNNALFETIHGSYPQAKGKRNC